MRTNNFSKVAGLRKLAAIRLWGKARGSALSPLEPCQPPAPYAARTERSQPRGGWEIAPLATVCGGVVVKGTVGGGLVQGRPDLLLIICASITPKRQRRDG